MVDRETSPPGFLLLMILDISCWSRQAVPFSITNTDEIIDRLLH